MGAEGIEPSMDGLRIRCSATERRTRMRRLSPPDESRRLRFLAATIQFSKTVYDPGQSRAVDGIRTRDSDLARRRVTPTLRPRTNALAPRAHVWRSTRKHNRVVVRAHLEPSSGVAPDPAPYESAALLLSYEGKRGPPRNRTSPRPFWRRSDAQHPRPNIRRSPHLFVFRAMLVR